MTTWDEMTDAKKLENVRRRHWRDYYKAEREAAKVEIARLEAINADLLAACEAIVGEWDGTAIYDGKSIDRCKIAIAQARSK